jgi:AcrR family transcriptional regulator
MKRKPISEATRMAILDATWRLIVKRGRLDFGQADIAKAAGVSRQTVYLAFGDRAGLLLAMARNRDTQTDHVMRLGKIREAESATPVDFVEYVGIWLDYLRQLYPVAILLDAASVTDPDVAAAYDDRMKGALLGGFKRVLRLLAKGGHLAAGVKPDTAAEIIWSLVHTTAWRQLVVELGWSPEEFRRSRLEIIRATVLAKDETGKKNHRHRR